MIKPHRIVLKTPQAVAYVFPIETTVCTRYKLIPIRIRFLEARKRRVGVEGYSLDGVADGALEEGPFTGPEEILQCFKTGPIPPVSWYLGTLSQEYPEEISQA